MALSLGVHKGSKIMVGDTLLRVLAVETPHRILIQYKGKQFLITDEERTEVAPTIFLSCGVKKHQDMLESFSKLAFEAPRSVKILRVPNNG